MEDRGEGNDVIILQSQRKFLKSGLTSVMRLKDHRSEMNKKTSSSA